MIFFVALFSYIIAVLSASISWYYCSLLALPLILVIRCETAKRRLYIAVVLGFFSLALFRELLHIRTNFNFVNRIGLVTKAEEKYAIIKTMVGSFYVKEGGFEIGDIVRIKGYTREISFSHYEGCFDFEAYLNRRFVFHELTLDSSSFIFKNLIRINAYKAFCLRPFGEDIAILVSSFIFGDSPSNLAEGRVLRQLGILRMLSTSGLHISFLLTYLNQKLSRTKYKKAFPYIEIAYLVMMMVLTSYKFGLVRIAFDRVIKLILRRADISLLPFPRSVVSALGMLIINPNYLFENAFLFTYIILFGLALNPFNFKREKKGHFFVFCSLIILPLSASLDYGFNPLSIILGFFLSPLFISCFLLSHLALLGPVLGGFLSQPFSFLYFLLQFADRIDVFLVTGKIPTVTLIIIYSLLFLAAYFRTIRYDSRAKTALLASLVFFLTPILPINITADTISFIDVDQGDSTLIRIRNKSYLVDTGGLSYVDLATESLIQYFHKEKIYSLEAVFITHRDYDHYGALDSLLKNFKVGSVYYNDITTYNGDGFSLTNLNNYHISTEENDLSAVFLLETARKKVLLMGDAPKQVEKKIIKDNPGIDVDILKVGHHGSNTSSDFYFLQSVAPELAVISCGKNNKYRHPSDEVIKSLEALSINYHRTDLAGTLKTKL